MGDGDCCGCCLCTILGSILTIILSLGSIVLVLWLIFRPQALKVHVKEASLSLFDLNSTSNHLSYNLSLDVSIRNPNSRVALYYDHIEASASYHGFTFGSDKDLPVFFQRRKNTTVIHPSFEGKSVPLATSTSIEESTYRREKEKGWFHVKVKIYTKVRFKVRFVKTHHFKPKFTCDLQLPAPSSEKAFNFTTTRCDVDLF